MLNRDEIFDRFDVDDLINNIDSKGLRAIRLDGEHTVKSVDALTQHSPSHADFLRKNCTLEQVSFGVREWFPVISHLTFHKYLTREVKRSETS